MDSHQDKLNQIRQKYGAKTSYNDYRARASSQYMPLSVSYIPSENTKRNYLNQRSSYCSSAKKTTRQDEPINFYSKSYLHDLTPSPCNASLAKVNKEKQIEKIREQYAVSRKKAIADFTRQINGSANKYDQKTSIYGKYDINPSSNLFDKSQIASKYVGSSYRGVDHSSDIYKKIGYRRHQQNPEFESKYSHALEKAYEFNKNLTSQNRFQSTLRSDLASITKNYSVHREFGKQYNLDQHRMSFGKIDSPSKISRKYDNLDRFYENSSPIKRVQNISDLQSRFSSRKSNSPTKNAKLSYLPKQNYENIQGSISARFKALSPSKAGGWGLGNIDRMQTKIQSILDEKKFRY